MAGSAPTDLHLGFLSVFQEANGYLGGYLVTNLWGRPLEFRLSSAVQPNKVQQILYGETLPNFICGELIGKTLLEKTTTPVQCVLTDNPCALDLRLRLETPVVLWSSTDAPQALQAEPNLYVHSRFPDDAAALTALIATLGPFDLSEPFLRIREAMGEARKMGVTSRSAA